MPNTSMARDVNITTFLSLNICTDNFDIPFWASPYCSDFPLAGNL